MKVAAENARIFFVNKFRWLDAAPMATISTFFTYALAELGYNTTLIIQGEPSTDANTILKEKFGLSARQNYQVKLFSRFRSDLLRASSNFYWKAMRHIITNCRNGDQIIVMTRNTNFLPYLVFLKKLYGVTAIYEAHGYHGYLTLPGFPPAPHRPYMKLSYQFQRIERICLNHIDGLVCITSPQKRLYENDFVKIPTIFLPLGAPQVSQSGEAVDSHDSYQHKKICYIGRLNQHIDYKMILKAMRILKDQTVKFVWIGLKPENFPVLEQEVGRQQLEERVEMIGWLGHSEMRRYLQEHVSAGLVAYRPTYQSMVFTAPSKILDYFAAGLPVIAPRMPTVEDIISDGKNGLLYRAEDSQSLAETITYLFENYHVYERLKNASTESAREYSWTNRARRMIRFMESLK